jgi:choline transporter-like protein 2/4/5
LAGDLETHTAAGGITYKTIHYDDNARNAIIFMVFMWFWTSTFIQAVGQLTVALSVSRWYFCKTKASSISSHTVVQSLGTTFRYHLGTAAFGSFVIAVVSTIRTTLLYVKKKFS